MIPAVSGGVDMGGKGMLGCQGAAAVQATMP